MSPTSIAPMSVSGVRHLIERAYREGGELQYLRELLINALEAEAPRVEFGPEWQAVAREGVYRLMVADNGKGMAPEDLLKFLNTFGGGGKPIGEAHDNFGVGAKTSLLPWNHAGVVVISWTPERPAGSLIWLMRDPRTGEYGAKKIPTDSGFEEVVEPFGEWAEVKPDWIEDHGTVVVCLGNRGTENTFLGKQGDGEIKGISAYLNKRIWEIPEGVGIYVQELRSTRQADWPRNRAEAAARSSGSKPDRRWNRRRIRGACYFATQAEGRSSGSCESGTVAISDGTEVDWYLWGGRRPAVDSYAHMDGYVAALYRNELYDTQTHLSVFRSFGVTQSAVRRNLTLIARPPRTDGAYGVYPDTARNSLKIRGDRRAGEPLPWPDWAQEFAEQLPGPIREALAQAGPGSSGTLSDEAWRQRLADRFGSRWRTIRYRPDEGGDHRINPDQSPGSAGGGNSAGGGGGNSGDTDRPGDRGQQSGRPNSSQTPNPSGSTQARSTRRRGGLPDFQWVTLEEIDETGAFAAAWCPPSSANPNGLVQIARDFPAFVEVRNHWRDRYPDHLGERVEEVVFTVYGEALVAKIAHSELLVSDPTWGRSRVETELRSPAALTMAVLGLFSEDQVISSRLAGLGVRRRVRQAPA